MDQPKFQEVKSVVRPTSNSIGFEWRRTGVFDVRKKGDGPIASESANERTWKRGRWKGTDRGTDRRMAG